MCFTHSQQEGTEGRATPQRALPPFIHCCFPQIQTLSDICGFHWTVCVLGNGLEVSPPHVSLARKRQTSEIRHLFHLADPVEGLEGLRAYITKTNIRHFRGLHHTNGIKLVGFSCVYVLRRCSVAVLKWVCWITCPGSLLGSWSG